MGFLERLRKPKSPFRVEAFPKAGVIHVVRRGDGKVGKIPLRFVNNPSDNRRRELTVDFARLMAGVNGSDLRIRKGFPPEIVGR